MRVKVTCGFGCESAKLLDGGVSLADLGAGKKPHRGIFRCLN
jgi:hypothetical protein